MRHRHPALAVVLAALLTGCGDGPQGTPAPGVAPPPSFVTVPGLPWARVGQRQVDEAAAVGVPVAFQTARGMRFVYIPSGSFEMGSPDDEPGRDPSETLHTVHIGRGFYMAVGGDELAQGPRSGSGDVVGQPPAFTHGWYAYIAQAESERNATWSFRLPTEAEWEYACRAGTQTRYWWGDGVPSDLGPYEYNPWGLRFTHTGVKQWCADRWGPLPSWTVSDPTGPGEGEAFVLRGGGTAAAPARAAQRHRVPGSVRVVRSGLRLVAPLGYGLGAYGSVTVTFRLVDRAGAPAANEACDLRVISMIDRLAARTTGADPVWARVKKPAFPWTTTMVPGAYYVYAEARREGQLVRGMEQKFYVKQEAVDRPVPVPDADTSRFGSGAHEEPK